MQFRMRVGKSWIFVILMTTVIVSRGALVSASPTTTLAAPVVVDKKLKPGSTFSINITVSEVEKLWGYQFILSYNTGVLTAIDYGFYSPFENPMPSEINDTAGYVAMASSTYMGDPDGFTTNGSVSIARIDFLVDAKGTSMLDIHNSSLSNIYGAWIDHDVLDGFFANVKTTIPDSSPTRATPSKPSGGSSREIEPLSPEIYYAGVKIDESSDARGVSGKLHIYKNYQEESTDKALFWLTLKRSDGTNDEWLQVGYYQEGKNYYLYTETVYAGTRDVEIHFQTRSLTDHYLEIVETGSPETFEARINDTSVKTYTFNIPRESATYREYQAMGEIWYGLGSLRGHMWNLTWYDSYGVSHIWEDIEVVEVSPPNKEYTVLLNTTNDFYATGSGSRSGVFAGDVNGDGVVNVLDGGEISAHWSKPHPESRLGPLGYDSNADIYPEMCVPPDVPDGKVDVCDSSLISANWS